jgi:hypothetical protein
LQAVLEEDSCVLEAMKERIGGDRVEGDGRKE